MPDFENKASFTNSYAQNDSPLALFVIADWDHGERRGEWIPRSQIDDDSEVWRLGQKGVLVISEWIALQKGLV